MMRENYRQSLLIALGIVSLLALTDTRVQAQGQSKSTAVPAVQLLLLPEDKPPEPPNIVFVTSVTYDGDLGGLAGADKKCQDRAVAAGLPGNTYRAWLSTSTVNAIDRLGSARGWVRVDGKPFADTKADIAAERILYPIRVDELGNDDDSTDRVWTATTTGGTLSSQDETCTDWTDSATGPLAGLGYSDATATIYTHQVLISCKMTARLYCFGIDHKAVVTVTPMAGRMAFFTKAAWTPGQGVIAADNKCKQEAQDAGLSGTFKAMLATEGNSAASRFDANGLPWVRPDGVAIAPTAAGVFSADFLDSPINQTADGLQYFGNFGVWTGAATPTTPGTSGTTCNNWESSSGSDTGVGGRASCTAQHNFFAFDSANLCSAGYLHLFCLQE